MVAVVTLEGDGQARGRAYAAACGDLVALAVERWCARVGDRWPSHVDELVDGCGFVATAERLVPDLAAEVEGIAAGSGLDRRLVWALNLMDEDWWVRERPDAVGGCSGLAVEPGAGQMALLAQNMDLPDWVSGLEVLLDVGPADRTPRVLAPAIAGMVATNALNERGLGVCVNTLDQLPHRRDGLPVALVIRRLASRASLADAVLALHELPHASGQNYLLGSPHAVIDLECGAGTVTEWCPEGGRLAHTNHPLGHHTSAEGGVVAHSGARLHALRCGLAELSHVGANDAMALLSTPPLRRTGEDEPALTAYSVVMELGEEPVLHLCGGPPTPGGYRAHRFTGR